MFWFAAVVIGALAAAVVYFAMIHPPKRGADANLRDLQLYRAQYQEIEADLARGTLRPDEAEAMRVEVSKRLLEADRRAQNGIQAFSYARNHMFAGSMGLAVFLGAMAVYWQLGAPRYPDLPLAERLANSDVIRASRPSQAVVEARLGELPMDPNAPAELTQALQADRAALQQSPEDVDLLVRIATAEAQLGRFRPAYEAMNQVLQLQGEDARAEQWTGYGLLQVYAVGGEYVSPEAEQAFRRALELNPNEPMAQYYIGLLYAQTDRPDLAFRLWRPLVERGPATAPWVPLAAERIVAVAEAAGIRYSLPGQDDGLAGPSAADVEAAQQMSEDDRRAMIESMVASLSDRLATEGGPPEAWARLIRSLVVLGRNQQAQFVLNEARGAFETVPDARKMMDELAVELGLE